MKLKLLILSLFIGFLAQAQTPLPGSTLVNARYQWLGGKFQQLKIPMYADTTQYPLWLPRVGGDMMLDTAGADQGVIYVRYNQYWHGVGGNGGTGDTTGYKYFSAQYPLILVGGGDTAYLSIDTTGFGGGGGSGLASEYRNVDSLRLKIAADGASATTLGYYTPGDGGGATWVYNASSSAVDDSGRVVKPTAVSGNGRWFQQFPTARINVKTYGAKGDGATNDFFRIKAALTAAGAQGLIVQFPKGTFQFNQPLIAPQNIIITGAGNRQTTLQQMADTVAMVISSSNMVTDIRFFGGNSYTASSGLKVQGGNKIFIQRVRAENFHNAGFVFIDAQNSLFTDLTAQYNANYNYYLDGTENCTWENCNGNSDNAMNGTPSTLSVYMNDCNMPHWNGGLHERGDGVTQIYITGATVDATLENMQVNNGSAQCILVDGGSTVNLEKIQFSNGGGWNVKTTGTNSRTVLNGCTTVGSTGLGNDKLYSGKNMFGNDIYVPLFSTNFSGSTSGSTVGAGVTLTPNADGQNMTISTVNANSGFETGLGSGAGVLRPGQIVEVNFNIKAIDDSSYIDVYNSYSGGRAAIARVGEGAHQFYYTVKGYETPRFGFLNPKSGSHSFIMSGLGFRLYGGSDSIPTARVTAPLQLGIYTPATDTTAKGTQLFNAAQTKSLFAATREVPASDTLGIASHRYPAGVYNLNKQFIGVAYNQAEAVSIWNANSVNTAVDRISAGSTAYSFFADTINRVFLQPQTTIGTIWNDEFTRGYFGPNYDTTDIGTFTRGFANGHLYLKRTIFAGDFAGIVKYIGHGKSTYRNIEVEVGYKMNTALNATTYGPVLGLFSTRNPDQNCSSLAYTNFSTDGTGLALGAASAGGVIVPKTTTTNFVTKDTVTNQVLNVSVNIDTLRGVMVNNLDEFVSASYFYDFNNTAQTATKPNIYYPAFGVNGTADVRFDYFKVYTKEKRYVKMVFLGNSITTGYYGGRAGNSFPDQLKGYTNYDIQTLAGGYNRSQDVIDNLPEAIDMHAQYAFLEIGSNDRGSGVSQAQLLANIDTINNRLARNGTTLYHLAAPDAGNPFTPGTTNYLLRLAYPTTFIDIFTGQYTAGTSVDAVHPNERGYKQIADSIAAKLPFLFPNPPKGTGRDYSSAVQRDIIFPTPVTPTLQQVTTAGNTTTARVEINVPSPSESGLKVGSMEVESLGADHGMIFNNMYYDQATGFKWRTTGAATMIQSFQGSMRFVAFNGGTGGTQANIGTYKQVFYFDNTGAAKLGGETSSAPASLDIDAAQRSLFNGRVIANLSLKVTDSLILARNALLTDLAGYDILARNRTDQSVYTLPFDSLTARIARAGGGGGTAPVVATAAEVNTGSDNAKFASPLALQGSEYEKRDGSKNYALTAGTATVLTAAFSPVFSTLTTGMSFLIKLHVTNSGSTTLTVDGNAAKNIVKLSGTSIVNVVSNDLPINSLVELRYNGTQFQIVSFISDQLKGSLAGTNTWAAAQTFSSAMQVNNTITSNNTITGATLTTTGRANVGSFANAYSAKTAAYTLLPTTDNSITADATTAAFNVTLPTAVGNTGLRFTVKRANSGANTVTLVTTSSQTIDGASTYVLSKQNDVATVLSDGANWRIVEMYTGGMWSYVTGGINYAGGNVGIATITPTARLHLPASTSSAGSAPIKIDPGVLLSSNESGVIEADSWGLYYTNTGGIRGRVKATRVVEYPTNSPISILADLYTDFIYTGSSTTTWTLPLISASYQSTFTIINAGSANITLNTNGATNDLYATTSYVNTMTITPGQRFDFVVGLTKIYVK